MSSRLLTAILLTTTALAARNADLNLYESSEPHMGTLFSIKLYSGDPRSAESAFQAAFARVTELDNKLSDYKPDSELNVAAKAAAVHPVQVSDDLMKVLKASQEMSAATNGAFDVTVGPLTKLWRAARKRGDLPDSDAIKSALERCGYTKLHLNEVASTIQVDRDDMQLDLGAIAKGYAADEALVVLSRLGIKAALVAASGDLAFSDAPPGQPGWKIGVDSLDRDDKPFTHVLTLSNAAVSTSGGTEQFLEVGGRRFSHIVDPKTGMGLERDMAVTTVSRRGLLADPAATAISVLGCERGLAFAESQKDIAALIVEQKDGRPVMTESSRFKVLRDKHGSN